MHAAGAGGGLGRRQRLPGWPGGCSTRSPEEEAAQSASPASRRPPPAEQLQAENDRLRALIGLRPALTVRSMAAEVLYDAPGSVLAQGRSSTAAPRRAWRLASPVINDAGVLGQVTRVYPLSSEVTLLADKDAAIPVLNARNQLRAAPRRAGGGMELRFMAGNADVQVGDLLTTSGVDGIYRPVCRWRR